MPAAKVTSKGQITIPREIRRALGLDSGDRVIFWVREDGVVEIRPETVDLMSLRGMLEPRAKGVTLDEMDEAIAEGAAE